METGAVVRAWGLILSGYRPNLSIEITRECPLRCPGCYAYGDTHLGGDVVLRQLADYKGQELIDGVRLGLAVLVCVGTGLLVKVGLTEGVAEGVPGVGETVGVGRVNLAMKASLLPAETG